MSGGTAQELWDRSACVQWRCVVATWLLTAWLMGDERAVINPPSFDLAQVQTNKRFGEELPEKLGKGKGSVMGE